MTTQPAAEFERLVAEGLAASREDRRDAALALFARAGELAPTSGVPQFLIGSEHASAGDFAAAELAFANAVLLAPDFPLARYQLGLLQFSSQRAPVALLTWQPLLSLPERESLLHFVRGFEALARDSYGECLRHFQEGLTCNEINQAMAADVRRVMEAVERLRDGAESAGDQHVLVSAYAKGIH
jgi:tetratricopeptide (TPR) repeat protein